MFPHPLPTGETLFLSCDPARLDLDRVHAGLAGTYWSPRLRRDVCETAFRNSIAAGAYAEEGARQVGVARVVTDRATSAWVCDVFVDEAWRGRGIARALVAHLLAHPELQTIRRWTLATADAHGVYAPLGFGPLRAPDRWMELRPAAARWQDPDPASPSR